MNKNIQYVKEAKSSDWADADLSKARPMVFPNLKPTREPVSLRIPGITLEKIRRLANRRGIPYQNLINSWLAERADAEMKAAWLAVNSPVLEPATLALAGLGGLSLMFFRRQRK